MSQIQKILITIGVVIIIAGVLWPYIGKIPFGRLPGDIAIEKPGFKFFFPVTTMILVSAVISVIVWLVKKF